MREEKSSHEAEFSAHEIHQLYEAMTDPRMRALIETYRQLPADKQAVITTIGRILEQIHALPKAHREAADALLDTFSQLSPQHQQLYLRLKKEWWPSLENHDS